ncbi:hypothetical protein [Ferrovibrio sp.]|uniref:hypothetical protein n=1 Tax=Ferrovibrio sp. TaxID=1917215 RepID=UPI003D0F2A28
MGLDHRRLTVVDARRADDRLWATEEGLRELGYGAVVAAIDSADLTETRRLQLAAEKSRSIGFLIRQDRQPSVALTCWRQQNSSPNAPLVLIATEANRVRLALATMVC